MYVLKIDNYSFMLILNGSRLLCVCRRKIMSIYNYTNFKNTNMLGKSLALI